MNGVDLMNNLIDELNRARFLIRSLDNADYTLLDDIHNDLERYYDYADSFDAVLADIIIE